MNGASNWYVLKCTERGQEIRFLPPNTFYSRTPFLRLRKCAGPRRFWAFSLVYNPQSPTVSHREHLGDRGEDLEGERPPGGTVCGERWTGRGEAGLRGAPGSLWKSCHCRSVLPALGLLHRHPQEVGPASWGQPRGSLCPRPCSPLCLSLLTPSHRGERAGPAQGLAEERSGCRGAGGGTPQLPSLQHTLPFLPFTLNQMPWRPALLSWACLG